MLPDMHDIAIMAGTAVIGAQCLDLRRRLSLKQQVMAGLFLLATGWTAMLGMSAAGPFPSQVGAAIGGGLLLTALVLLLPSASQSLRAKPRRKA